jgi:arginine deiminase
MTYTQPLQVGVSSEIGKLEGVILHRPGSEVENMTPTNAERALYSDILNLPVSQREYAQLEGVLDKVAHTFQVKELLTDVLENVEAKYDLIRKICHHENQPDICKYLLEQDAKTCANSMVEGMVLIKDNLTKYLNKERYALPPLHNFFFTRDASITINDTVLISKMASQVREREALVMEAIFKHHPSLRANTINPLFTEGINQGKVTIEGGDVLIARQDVQIVGIGARTTSQGVDFILEKLKQNQGSRHILVQELPLTPESFIHLDMVFTFLDKDLCMVYEPVILQPNRYETVHIEVKDGKVCSIHNEENLITGLASLGMDVKPLFTGGRTDQWVQDREQWHSGANFFAFAPGKVIGYERNSRTIEELSNNGFEVLKAWDVINGKVHPDDYKRCVVTIEGSELPRGGGGARCMTMPVARQAVEW